MTSSANSEFEIMERGKIRDLILEHFRSGLRNIANPETGELFSEDDIAAATGPGTRWYRQAQAIDDYGQGEQRRALWLNDQLRIDRACTQWLEEYHSPIWDPEGRLKASHASGLVRIPGTAGTPIAGSTTLPDETAHWGRTASGVRVQVFSDATIGAGGYVLATMAAMDPGAAGNIQAGEIITWANRDPSMGPQATVEVDWTGGFDAETDVDWANRMESNQRHRPGSGNPSQQRDWARRASTAVEDAFVYPCAFGDGSCLICITQKRSPGDTTYLARNPSFATLAAVTTRLTPPASPVNPTPPRAVVVAPWWHVMHAGIRLDMEKGSSLGWADFSPFPTIAADDVTELPRVFSTTASTATIYSPNDATLPGRAAGATVAGSECPKLMVWKHGPSEFTDVWEEITGISQIVNYAPNLFEVSFTSLTCPAHVVTSRIVSPLTALHPQISQAVRDYVDAHGPGELYTGTDINYARSKRFPEQRETRPFRVGSDIAMRVGEALDGYAGDTDAPFILVAAIGTAPFPIAPKAHCVGPVGVYPR